ncbi:DUF6480 family protein [Kitasatospora sp. NPDC094015]|uniref:DUF6480 family protein n=1 Tax=Kitasatospora sp. NPDC094015 TaxID=3155205 RepID=UPI003331A869
MSESRIQRPPSEDQADLYAWAWRSGWAVDQLADRTGAIERMLMTRPHRSVEAVFSHDGAFCFARVAGPDGPGPELDLAATLDVLEGEGESVAVPDHVAAPDHATVPHRGVAPTETPPGEASTTAGISVPEPDELRNAWGVWPLLVIGLLVVCVLAFLVARIFAW